MASILDDASYEHVVVSHVIESYYFEADRKREELLKEHPTFSPAPSYTSMVKHVSNLQDIVSSQQRIINELTNEISVLKMELPSSYY